MVAVNGIDIRVQNVIRWYFQALRLCHVLPESGEPDASPSPLPAFMFLHRCRNMSHARPGTELPPGCL